MRFTKLVSVFVSAVLVYMLACPAIHASVRSVPQEKCHGGKEQQQTPKDSGMEACCDQAAVSVQQFHLKLTTSISPLKEVVPPISQAHLHDAPAFATEPPAVRDDYLSSLCILRI